MLYTVFRRNDVPASGNQNLLCDVEVKGYGLFAQPTSGHAPEETADGVLGDLFPGLRSLWWSLVVFNELMHNVP